MPTTTRAKRTVKCNKPTHTAHNRSQRKTGGLGLFKPFIAADNNREYVKMGKTWKKTTKGLDVQLKRDKNGDPIAWFVRHGDNNVLAKLFNTRKKGTLLSHAMFCKLFMRRDSLLSKRYPHLISKANAQNIKCPHDARHDGTLKLARKSPIRNPEPNEPGPEPRPVIEPLVPLFRPEPRPVIEPLVPLFRPEPRPEPRPVIEPLVPLFRPTEPEPGPRPRPVIEPLVPRARQVFSDESIADLRSRSVMSDRFISDFQRGQGVQGVQGVQWVQGVQGVQGVHGVQGFKNQRFNPHGVSARTDLEQLLEMGFDKNKAMHALKKYNNDIAKAIDACLRDDDVRNPMTRNERRGNSFATLIQLQDQIKSRQFDVIDNGGAGDCLFLSLAETLIRAHKLKPQPHSDLRKIAFDLRQELVNYVMRHLNQFFIQSTQQTFGEAINGGVIVSDYRTLYMHDYEYEMKKQHTYGTEIEISAAAQLYKINIYVVNTNGIGWDQLYIGTPAANATWANTWYIFNMNKGHYTSLA